MSGEEWDRNLPTYTNDFVRMFSIDGHLCGCHLQREQCYGCEAMDCKFHEKGRVVSDVEALARVLDPAESFTDTDGEMSLRIFSGKDLAERILADPGPLLEALAEAGVLAPFVAAREAKAWDEGKLTGWSLAMGYMSGDPKLVMPPNPYRIERGES